MLNKNIFYGWISAILTGAGSCLSLTSMAIAQTQIPTIYVDSRIERVYNGTNVLQHNYKKMLETCYAAALPTTKISDEDVSLIGVTRLQRWFDVNVFAMREESWAFQFAGESQEEMCQFSLVYDGRHIYADPNDYKVTNLVTNTSEIRPFTDVEIFDRQALTDNIANGNVSEINGQSCITRTQTAHEICVWNGGRDWGFLTTPTLFDSRKIRQMNDRIILRQEPVQGSGTRVTTENFTFGVPFTSAPMHQ